MVQTVPDMAFCGGCSIACSDFLQKKLAWKILPDTGHPSVDPVFWIHNLSCGVYALPESVCGKNCRPAVVCSGYT
jgi:hypothetical protein